MDKYTTKTTETALPKQFRIKKIAGKTQHNCATNGYGPQILVYRNGDTSYSHGENDEVARSAISGGWEYPLLRLRYPMTMAQVRAKLIEALAEPRY